MSEQNLTPNQINAGERAMAGLEAQADIWADETNLVVMVKNCGKVARGLTDRMPKDVREGFIGRLEAQIDAIARQAYLEGFYRGGESRKEYDAQQASLRGLSASEIACYRWPEDTAEHRAMRAAFCDGASALTPAEGDTHG